MSAPQPDPGFVFGHPEPEAPKPALVPESHAEAHARDFLREHLGIDTERLNDALAHVYGDAYAAGVTAALQSTKSGTPVPGVTLDIPTSVDQWNAYWGSWTPGQDRTEALLRGGGLAALLDRQGITINGITGTTLDRLGNVLAAGAARGDSVDKIARDMHFMVDDPYRARMIATTEIARAMSAGSTAQYRQDGVTKVDLITSPGACPTCMNIASGNPINLRDAIVPVHPNCRCSLGPVLNDLTPAGGLSQDLLTVAGAASGAAAVEEGALTGLGEELRSIVDDQADNINTALGDEHDRRDGEEDSASGLDVSNYVNRDLTQDEIYGDNTGAGDNLDAENHNGTGMSVLDLNTGGGTNGQQDNLGGSLDNITENNGEGDPIVVGPQFPDEAAPAAAKPPTKRTRRRTRRTKG